MAVSGRSAYHYNMATKSWTVLYQMDITFGEGYTPHAIAHFDLHFKHDGKIDTLQSKVLSMGKNLDSDSEELKPGMEAEYHNIIDPDDPQHDYVLFDLGRVYNRPDGKINDDDKVIIQLQGLVTGDLTVSIDIVVEVKDPGDRAEALPIYGGSGLMGNKRSITRELRDLGCMPPSSSNQDLEWERQTGDTINASVGLGNECNSLRNPCGAKGKCVDDFVGYHCECNPGWGGRDCSVDIDECTERPCQQGDCVDLIDAFRCDCYDGFTGLLCDMKKTDECTAQTCKNGGVCSNTRDGFRCSCHPDFVGPTCEIRRSDCSQQLCSGRGQCAEDSEDYLTGGDGKNFHCKCDGGWSGANCEMNPCEARPCRQGRCMLQPSLASGYSCECDEDWSGTDCSIPAAQLVLTNTQYNKGTTTYTYALETQSGTYDSVMLGITSPTQKASLLGAKPTDYTVVESRNPEDVGETGLLWRSAGSSWSSQEKPTFIITTKGEPHEGNIPYKVRVAGKDFDGLVIGPVHALLGVLEVQRGTMERRIFHDDLSASLARCMQVSQGHVRVAQSAVLNGPSDDRSMVYFILHSISQQEERSSSYYPRFIDPEVEFDKLKYFISARRCDELVQRYRPSNLMQTTAPFLAAAQTGNDPNAVQLNLQVPGSEMGAEDPSTPVGFLILGFVLACILGMLYLFWRSRNKRSMGSLQSVGEGFAQVAVNDDPDDEEGRTGFGAAFDTVPLQRREGMGGDECKQNTSSVSRPFGVSSLVSKGSASQWESVHANQTLLQLPAESSVSIVHEPPAYTSDPQPGVESSSARPSYSTTSRAEGQEPIEVGDVAV